MFNIWVLASGLVRASIRFYTVSSCFLGAFCRLEKAFVRGSECIP